MSGIASRRGSTNSLVIPSNEERRVSLTGYTNVVFNDPFPDVEKDKPEENEKVR